MESIFIPVINILSFVVRRQILFEKSTKKNSLEDVWQFELENV